MDRPRHVVVAAGAKILGPITIASGSAIGANAVVVRDVPADSVAVGIPAKVSPKAKLNATREGATVPDIDWVDPAIFI